MPDHIAAFRQRDPVDLEQSGVKGMRWGVRRDRAQLRAAAKARGDAPAKKESTSEKAPASSGSSGKKPAGNIQDNVESSSERYARLAGQAKAGQASAMSEQDLKFFNARTEALAKINKQFEEQPSWLRETAVKVVQQSAQRQMQGVADALADKYIGDPIKNSLKGVVGENAASGAAKAVSTVATTTAKTAETVKTSTTESSPKKSVSQRIQEKADSISASKRAKGDKQYEETAKKIAESDAAKASNPRLLNVTESIQYYKNNPTATPEPPVGLTPNAQRIWLDEVRRARGN